MSIKNISDFITELRKIPGPRKTELFFRGHSDVGFELKPSIYRSEKLISNENIIIKRRFFNDKSRRYSQNIRGFYRSR